MEGITFVSIIIFYGALQGLILAFSINRIKDRNQQANRLLAFFILLISLVLFSRLVYEKGVTIWQTWPHLFLLPDLPMFLYGPIFYFYIKKLLLKPAKKYKYWWLHFIPFATHLFILSYYCLESRAVYLNRIIHGNLWEVPYAAWASSIHIALYLGWSYTIFRRYLEQVPAKLSHQPQLTYLKIFFLLASLCWLTWLYSNLADLFSHIPEILVFNYHLSWVALSFITFMLSYYAMGQQEVFKVRLQNEKYAGSGLTHKQLEVLEQQLQEIMKTAKPFLNSTLTRQQLATQLGIHPKDLSRVINERFSMNFFDYINSHRIKEFQRIAGQKKYQHLNLLGMALEAGFNSKTTFNTSFKKFTGMTPSDYIRILNIEQGTRKFD